MKINKKTYKRNVAKLSKEFELAWSNLEKLYKKFGLNDKQIDLLCDANDRYIDLNAKLYNYCIKNEINISDFACDVLNCSASKIK